jgi:hypothetical protein
MGKEIRAWHHAMKKDHLTPVGETKVSLRLPAQPAGAFFLHVNLEFPLPVRAALSSAPRVLCFPHTGRRGDYLEVAA